MEQQAAITFILEKLESELDPVFTYHDLRHTLDVINACAEISEAERIGPQDRKLLLTAAAYHDAGFLENTKAHEEAGCQIAHRILPMFQYTHEEIEQICGMIIATRLPQSPTNQLEAILCDADLDYLGRDDFNQIGNGLYLEFKARGILETEQAWNRLQVQFLESHRYFTETNRARRNPQKLQHLVELKKIVAAY